MALVSPGVEVTIIDQSQYLPAASNSVPLILLATAQNKANAAGTATAVGTTKANANKLYQVTSQRDLTTLFGNPFFYKTTNGTPIHGYELNEYGLLAAYSLMGTTNRAYILRADIDLGGFVGSISRPFGEPADGTYWLDTTTTSWGIYQFDAALGEFISKDPLVIMDSMDLASNVPKDSLGNIGDYAVVAQYVTGEPLDYSTYFYKNRFNSWVALGSNQWKKSIPTVTATNANPLLTAGDSFTISAYDASITYTITVPAGPNNTVDGLVTAINNKNDKYITASNISGKLAIYVSQVNTPNPPYIVITANNGTVLADLGITPKYYFAPAVSYGPSSNMPLWSASQAEPHPTGSVWIKTSTAGNGLNLALSKYKISTGSFSGVNVLMYSSDAQATAGLDSTGGKSIAQDTVYAQYNYGLASLSGTSNITIPTSAIRLFKRLATGPTVATSTTANPITQTSRVLYIQVSTPGAASVSATYTLTTSGTSAETFVRDWSSLSIPNTTAIVTSDNTIQLTHTQGGEIYLTDKNIHGVSNGLLTTLGFIPGITPNVKYGPALKTTNTNANQSATTGTGQSFNATVEIIGGVYRVSSFNGGTGYAVGDRITIDAAQLVGTSPNNDLILIVTSVNAGAVTGISYYKDSSDTSEVYGIQLSNWVEIEDYVSNEGAPVSNPGDGTYWYYSTPTQVDIMVKKGSAWVGYRNTNYDNSGHPASSGSNATDLLGPIMSATIPTTQTDGTPLVSGDLWIDTGDLENYPMIYRWQAVKTIPQWVLLDKTDQTSSNGILFADARWGSNGSIDPVNDPIPSIAGLLTSNYLDLDAPNPALYPQGMLLFNTRRSGYNVKEFKTNYFIAKNYPNAGAYNSAAPANASNLPIVSYAWVSASGLREDGAAHMGRKAQRNLVVKSLKSAISTNMSIREEDNFFNIMSCPGYPELQPEMIALNNERNNTAYIVGDTPLRLRDQATELVNWATNEAGATATGEEGWVSRDTYLGVFYPSGITTDLTGTTAVVPASHMMLRTLLRNDTIAYPWLAPAGTRRGTIDNATNIGYLDSVTGEFQTVKNRMSIRDVLYTNQINPLAFFTGVGLLNYGNKNSFDSQSALDRINVARLVAYIRERLQVAARPFVFEPNDALTRSQLTGVVQSLFIDLVAKRGLYDYLVVCDSSNNTPSRIDRNELWVDIAIEPVKAAEFIYIPVRVLNTGALGAA